MERNAKLLLKIGNNIRKFRNKKGISQQVLADYSEIAKSTLQRIEKGELNPSILIIIKISQILEINITDITN